MTTLDGQLFGERNHCFGCGPAHPHGFRLQLRVEGNEVVCDFLPQPDHESVPTIMHGGLVATLVDELGGWVLIGLRGKFGFTAEMTSRFLRPVRIGQPVHARGRIVRESSRVVHVSVQLKQNDVECVTSELKFAILGEAAAEQMIGGPVPEAWQRFLRGAP